MSDEIRNNPAFNNFKSVQDLAQAHLEAQKLIGKKGIIPPSEGASQKEMDNFYAALGRPNTPKEYKVDDIQAPEGLSIDNELRDSFLNKAHSIGLLPYQVRDLMQWQLENDVNSANADTEATKKSINEATTALRNEWGAGFDANVALAERVVNQFADGATKDALRGQLGNDPRFVKMLANIGKSLSEDTLGEGVAATMVMTPAEAQAEISKIRSDKNHPYWHPEHVENKSAKMHMNNLYKMAYPEQKQK